MSGSLPKFTEHEGHTKLEPLTQPIAPSLFVQDFLDEHLSRSGRPRSDLKVLDVGCGRGDTVAWLCDQGWDAYGVDLDQRYLEEGRPYLEHHGHGTARLQPVSRDYPFPDRAFDLVLSDQVIEHVADLDAFFSEVARVSRVGGAGLHIFPARWRPVESHLLTPLVHWLPKGRSRRLLLRPLLALGLAAPYFADRPLAERVQIFGDYSDTETFYRSPGELRGVCARHGLLADVSGPARSTIAKRVPRLPGPLVPLAAVLYQHSFSVRLQTQRKP